MEKKKAILLLLLIGAVYFFLKILCPLFLPVLIAGVFLTLCYPTFDDVQKKTRIKKQYLAGTILFCLCAILIVIVWVGGYALIRNLPNLIKGIDKTAVDMKEDTLRLAEEVEQRFQVDMTATKSGIEEQFDYFYTHFEETMLPKIIGNTWGYITLILKTVGVLAITMIATILLAKDYDTLLAKTGARAGGRLVLEIFLSVIHQVSSYLKAQFWILCMISGVCMLGLSFILEKYGLPLGLLAGILDALPFIGTGIVLLPCAVVKLIGGSYLKALGCVALYGLCALIRQFVEPKLVGKRVGVYPIAVLASVYAGVRLFGVAGILKGPLGLILLTQSYACIGRYIDNKTTNEL